MSSKTHSSSAPYTRIKTLATLATLLIIGSLATTGCSTTHELKPTASVIVGGHKSI